jgi:hypothetical protein
MAYSRRTLVNDHESLGRLPIDRDARSVHREDARSADRSLDDPHALPGAQAEFTQTSGPRRFDVCHLNACGLAIGEIQDAPAT